MVMNLLMWKPEEEKFEEENFSCLIKQQEGGSVTVPAVQSSR